MARDFLALRKQLLDETKLQLRESVSSDQLIVQAVLLCDDLRKVANGVAKRLREWYELYNPEFSHSISSHEKFSALILEKNKEELLKELGVKDGMGAELSEEDLSPILSCAEKLQSFYSEVASLEKYVEKKMKSCCPNLLVVAGPALGGKLLSLGGSLAKLARFPASTIQLLGAEKALFRHLRSGARAPKHGIIHEHPLLLKHSTKFHGKIARVLADKISIAVKVDYFKGEFVGDDLRKQVEGKVSAIVK